MSDTFLIVIFIRVGDVLLGLSCLAFLLILNQIKCSLASLEENPSTLVKTSRVLVWTLATGELTNRRLSFIYSKFLYSSRSRSPSSLRLVNTADIWFIFL